MHDPVFERNTKQTMPQPPAVTPADILWQDGVPESRQFGDVYFSRDNGLEETRYVFLGQNRLAERFAALAPGEAFVIAESGFGTGLNFLAAWQQWRASAPSHAGCMHFVSVERYPLTSEDLARALALWPELAEQAEMLIRSYPPLVEGVHRLVFDGGKVRLTLFFGEAQDGWRQLNFTADAWFLDGFAPALNPELWLDDVIASIRRHSKPGTTLATFTSVGRVRRALASAGFEMAKVSGYGRKREMLAGHLPRIAGETGASPSTARPATVAIIGAGIAGSALARNLAERGVRVHLLDEAEEAGTAASGNRQGALYVKLGVEFSYQTRFALSALLFSQRYYLANAGPFWHPCGLLQLATDDEEQDRQDRFLRQNQYPTTLLRGVDAREASDLCGVGVPRGGLWFPDNGWLEPGNLCRTLSDHPNIQCHFGHKASRLMPCNGQWHITIDGCSDLISDQVVLCAGHRTPELIPVPGGYRFRAIRGQVSLLDSAEINAPKAVICGTRYLNPDQNGTCLSGATFDLHSTEEAESATSHQKNIDALTGMLPGIWKSTPPDADRLTGKVGFRCTTHDYQPAVGPLTGPDGSDLGDIDVLTGLGSKGLSFAPLLTEYLADRLTGQPWALPIELAERLAPDRCRQQ